MASPIRPTANTIISSFQILWDECEQVNKFASVVVPLALLASFFDVGNGAVFALNYASILPLSYILHFATEEVSLRLGPTWGGLLHITFGNLVELVLGIYALNEDLFHIVRAIMFGSILSNLLLVLGLCFLIGGIIPFEKNKYQEFDVDNANVSTGLLTITILGFVIPVALSFEFPEDEVKAGVVGTSRFVAVMLLLTYAAYILFHHYTNPEGLKVTPTNRNRGSEEGAALLNENGEDQQTPRISLPAALIMLATSSALIVVSCEELVQTIVGLSLETGINDSFIATIILPIIINTSVQISAITAALQDRMDYSLRVVIGSSHQVGKVSIP
ncbi:hypothetical protein HDU79_001553 [Rhizoclosmatium sp. JEL0117]|nr:hypothetical protein HDU79_001553 [Rhizoclosmatium sp. JEL0117]